MATEVENQVSVTESQASSVGEYDEDDTYSYDGDEIDVDMVDDGQSRDDDPEKYDFNCLTQDQVWQALNTEVTKLSTSLSVDASTARALLNYNNWKSSIVINRFQTDRHQLLTDAHVYPSKPTGLLGLVINECPICFVQPSNTVRMLGLGCGHLFCSQCWNEHILAKLERGLSTNIECMECDVQMTMEMIQEIVTPEVYDKYLKLALFDFILSHNMLRWCPGNDCPMIFKVEEARPKCVTCTKCNTQTCFQCGEEYHCPTDCETIKSWLIKCQDDSETANYITANTKDCPNCHTAIEKNGGCNHMNCTKCNHDFCWMCLGDWSKHSTEYYECSRYKANPDVAKEKSTQSREALKKYLFYYQRWDNHHNSLLLEEHTRSTIQQHIEEMVTKNEGTWIDWQYLLDAADLLRKCRYTLKYTYPRAYWMEGDTKPLFEYQQAQLELEIENLSWKVERATRTDRAELEQQMSITEIRRVTLLRDFIL